MIGSVGAGKSLLAEELSAATGLPVLPTDKLRHLIGLSEIKRLDISQIDGRQQRECADALKLWETLMKLGFTEKKLSHFYAKHGFDKTVSQEVEQKHGPLGWHCYQKQFEFELLRHVVTTLKQPVILDLGAGMAISLDKEYGKIKNKMLADDEKLYERCFNQQSPASFEEIKKLLSDFDKIVYLQLPKDYGNKMAKAAGDRLNKNFLASKQFEQLATMTVNVDGLIDWNKKNKEKATSLANKIVNEKTRT